MAKFQNLDCLTFLLKVSQNLKFEKFFKIFLLTLPKNDVGKIISFLHFVISFNNNHTKLCRYLFSYSF